MSPVRYDKERVKFCEHLTSLKGTKICGYGSSLTVKRGKTVQCGEA